MPFDTFGRPIGIPLPPPAPRPSSASPADLARVAAQIAARYAEEGKVEVPRLFFLDFTTDPHGQWAIGVAEFPDGEALMTSGPPAEVLAKCAAFMDDGIPAHPQSLLGGAFAFALAYGAWKVAMTDRERAAMRAMDVQVRDHPEAADAVGVVIVCRDGRVVCHDRAEGEDERDAITRVAPRIGAPSVAWNPRMGLPHPGAGADVVMGGVPSGLAALLAATGPYAGAR